MGIHYKQMSEDLPYEYIKSLPTIRNERNGQHFFIWKKVYGNIMTIILSISESLDQYGNSHA